MPVLSLDAKPGMTGQQYAKVLEKVHRNVQKLASAEMRKYQNRIDARKSYEAKRRKKEEAEAEESAEDDEAEESDDSGALDSFGTPAVARPVPERQPRRTKRSASAALIASVASLPAKTKRACSPQLILVLLRSLIMLGSCAACMRREDAVEVGPGAADGRRGEKAR